MHSLVPQLFATLGGKHLSRGRKGLFLKPCISSLSGRLLPGQCGGVVIQCPAAHTRGDPGRQQGMGCQHFHDRSWPRALVCK
mgnify:CR=1 FL=1